MAFIWSDSLDIGVELINDDHKNLITIANDFLTACYEGQGSQAIEETVDKLLFYTIYHFDREEALMDEHQYPALAEHQEQHAFFIKWVTDMKDKVAEQSDKQSLDVLQFLEDWLISHITNEDKKIGLFLKEKAVT